VYDLQNSLSLYTNTRQYLSDMENIIRRQKDYLSDSVQMELLIPYESWVEDVSC